MDAENGGNRPEHRDTEHQKHKTRTVRLREREEAREIYCGFDNGAEKSGGREDYVGDREEGWGDNTTPKK